MIEMSNAWKALAKHGGNAGLSTSPMFAKGSRSFGTGARSYAAVLAALTTASKGRLTHTHTVHGAFGGRVFRFNYTDSRIDSEEYTQTGVGVLLIDTDGCWLATGCVAAYMAHRLPIGVVKVHGHWRTRFGYHDRQPVIPQSEELQVRLGARLWVEEV